MADRIANLALVGFGLSGAYFHAPFIAADPRLNLAAVVTSDAERASQVRASHPDAEILATPDEAFATADRYDAIVIAAPNRVHLPLAAAAIDAGLAVVVDKPLAISAIDAGALIEHASAEGVMLTVFQNRRWDGDFLTVRRLVESGGLGAVHRFESRFERWRPNVAEAWREDPDPAAGGGVLLDLGSHLVDQALQLFGPAAETRAEVRTLRDGARVDDDVFLAITHKSGTVSHLYMSALAAIEGPRFRVLGDRAAYEKAGMDPQEDALRAGRLPGGPDWGEYPESEDGVLGAGGDVTPVRTDPGDYGAFYTALARTLLDGAPGPVDAADALAVAKILDASAA